MIDRPTHISEARRAELFARDVCREMLRLRGWSFEGAPREVRDDVFSTMTRHERLYSTGFRLSAPPVRVATLIQNMEWDGA